MFHLSLSRTAASSHALSIRSYIHTFLTFSASFNHILPTYISTTSPTCVERTQFLSRQTSRYNEARICATASTNRWIATAHLYISQRHFSTTVSASTRHYRTATTPLHHLISSFDHYLLLAYRFGLSFRTLKGGCTLPCGRTASRIAWSAGCIPRPPSLQLDASWVPEAVFNILSSASAV